MGASEAWRLPELERFAQVEMRVAQIVSPRCRRVGEGAALGRGIEMRAVLACEAEREASYLVRESIVDEGPHGRRRSRATTVSTWLVCGNISNVAIDVGR